MPYKERKVVKINPNRVKYRKMKHLPKSEEEQNKLADDFFDWCFQEGNNEAEDFPLSRNHNPYRFFKLADHNPYFAQVLIAGKYVLGSKIKRDVRAGDLELGYLKEMLGFYNPEYRQLIYDRIQRNQDQLTKTEYTIVNKVTVEADPIPTSTLVPSRKDDEE